MPTHGSARPGLALFFTRGMSLAAWDQGGLLERELAVYRRLHAGGIDVRLVSYGGRGELPYENGLGGIRLTCNRWGLRPGWYEAAVERLCPAAWPGARVFKSNQVLGADIALRAAQRFGRRFVARCGYLYSTIQEHGFGPESPQARAARALEREVFLGADRVVVTTPAIRETVARRYGVPEDRLRVIPNCVDTEVFRPDGGARRDPRRVCFVGRLQEEKNPAALVEAARGLDLELVLVGRGPLEGALREKALRDGVRVRFLGIVPNRELPAVLNGCGAFVLPSFYEGHPKALIEAMACGLPVIGADSPGIRELLRDRENGRLCGTSAADIRAALEEVTGDAALRESMGRRALESVRESFSLDRVAGLELELLSELAS